MTTLVRNKLLNADHPLLDWLINTNSNNYTINKTMLNTAAVVIAVVVVVNIVSHRQFLFEFDHYIRMFHCLDVFILNVTYHETVETRPK